MYTAKLLPYHISLTFCLSIVAAWGGIGHRTIGYLSWNYMNPAARDFFERYVRPDSNFDIGDAAVWADGQKRSTWAKYTDTWHFIDAHDKPPNQCNVDYERDCKGSGCVVGAILNMTNRITDRSLPAIDITNSTKFLLHFIGDLSQPLHTEDKGRGGNDIHVTFDGRNSNLHKVWDGQIIEQVIDYKGGSPEKEKKAASKWAKELYQENEEVFKLHAGDECVPHGDADEALDCVLGWTKVSNKYICTYVLNESIFPGEDQEVGGDYAEGAFPIIKTLVIRAAVRFAYVMNEIAWSADVDGMGQHVLDGEL